MERNCHIKSLAVFIAFVLGTVFRFEAGAHIVVDNAGSVPPQSDTIVSETFHFYYRWDEAVVDTTYLDNEANIAKIRRHLRNSPRIDSITVYTYSSPEGAWSYNQRLSERRAVAAKKFILENAPDSILSAENVHLCPVAENWEGLYREVEASYHRWDRDWVLRTIKADIPPETKEWRFKNHDNGIAWRILQKQYMPKLRLATWICVWVSVPDEVPEEAATTEPESVIPQRTPVKPMPAMNFTHTETFSHKIPHSIDLPAPKLVRTVAALKTNLLYDVVTALNFEVEVPIGNRFSIMIEDVFPWWTWGPNGNKYAFQMWEMGIEPRWWFKRNYERDRLAGHFAGVYAMSAKYDFQWDFKGCYQGEYWSAGLTYGYAMPLCKWLNMEFSVSVGYLRGPYRHYVPSDGYEVLWRDKYLTGTFSYFGLTKAKISLVVPIWYRYTPGGRKAWKRTVTAE